MIMGTYVEVPSPMGGVMWKGNYLEGVDSGYSLMDSFIKEHEHAGWVFRFLTRIRRQP